MNWSVEVSGVQSRRHFCSSMVVDKRVLKTKGQLTRQRLIEGAFRCIARDGLLATTFQSIADETGYSQPLVVRYFGTKEEIFPTTIRYFVDLARIKTEKALKNRATSTRALDLLKIYLEVSFEIFLSSRDLRAFYLSIYGHSPYEETVRIINQEIRAHAVARIGHILKRGMESDDFHFEIPIDDMARAIHSALTGALMNWILDDHEYDATKGSAIVDLIAHGVCARKT